MHVLYVVALYVESISKNPLLMLVQVSDGRLRRGLIVAAEHPQPPKFGVVNQISIGFRV